MLRLKRLPGTGLIITVDPSTEPQEILIEFNENHKIGIEADVKTVHILRDDAINRQEKPCQSSIK